MVAKWLQRLSCGVLCAAVLITSGVANAQEERRGAEQGPRFVLENSVDATFFTVRRDTRKCAFPMCGGFFAKRVNRKMTLCADGTARSECYVAEIDLGRLGISEDLASQVRAAVPAVLIEGTIVQKRMGRTSADSFGVLRAESAFRGHDGVSPSGVFFRVVDNGIVCITTPCGSLNVQVLNSMERTETLAGLDLSGITEDSSDAQAQLRTADGLLVAARRVRVTGPGGRAQGLDASEYYLPFSESGKACGSRGLGPCGAGQFCAFPAGADCGRADAPGVCTRRPEICIDLFNPVCGCDGQTYSNSCQANAAGVSVETKGECR